MSGVEDRELFVGHTVWQGMLRHAHSVVATSPWTSAPPAVNPLRLVASRRMVALIARKASTGALWARRPTPLSAIHQRLFVHGRITAFVLLRVIRGLRLSLEGMRRKALLSLRRALWPESHHDAPQPSSNRRTPTQDGIGVSVTELDLSAAGGAATSSWTFTDGEIVAHDSTARLAARCADGPWMTLIGLWQSLQRSFPSAFELAGDAAWISLHLIPAPTRWQAVARHGQLTRNGLTQIYSRICVAVLGGELPGDPDRHFAALSLIETAMTEENSPSDMRRLATGFEVMVCSSREESLATTTERISFVGFSACVWSLADMLTESGLAVEYSKFFAELSVVICKSSVASTGASPTAASSMVSPAEHYRRLQFRDTLALPKALCTWRRDLADAVGTGEQQTRLTPRRMTCQRLVRSRRQLASDLPPRDKLGYREERSGLYERASEILQSSKSAFPARAAVALPTPPAGRPKSVSARLASDSTRRAEAKLVTALDASSPLLPWRPRILCFVAKSSAEESGCPTFVAAQQPSRKK